MALWKCHETAAAAAHVHDYDEYMLVVQGCYTLIIDGQRIALDAGIPRGVLHAGEVFVGTRTIHAFGGHRANRIQARGPCESYFTIKKSPMATASMPAQ